MSRRSEPKEEMVNRILSATESLIVQEGLQNLSMRSIAKEAGQGSLPVHYIFTLKPKMIYCTHWLPNYSNVITVICILSLSLKWRYLSNIKRWSIKNGSF